MTDQAIPAPLLSLRGVTASVDEKTILRGIDLTMIPP